MNDTAAERAEAARLLHRVAARRQTTDQAFAGVDHSPLVQELVFGSLRHYFSLRRLIGSLLTNPLKPKDQELMFLMIVGAYQLIHMRVPDHAAIFETVNACRLLGRPWATGLVNAVLRKCAQARPEAERSFEHPEWLEGALREGYEDAESIMAANNARAPMTLRINLARTTPEAYLAHLEAARLAVRPTNGTLAGSGEWVGPETQVMLSPISTQALPGHSEGLVSVQDAGAQVAANLLAPRPGDRVLDACAAPGGKLFHLIERYPEAQLIAVEKNPRRMEQLRGDGRRLGHSNYASLIGDATSLDWWDGIPFQQVLIDAPCSGTGTLRRHPDIKVLRKQGDITAFAGLQQRLLANLWRTLSPGGNLLYCTCSLLAAENDSVIGAFLAQQQDASVSTLKLSSGRATRHGWQLLPTDPDTDGFYYARMIKALG
jgi:16S rRNA (cytosine967-C5)-methyltransferase